MGWSLTSPCGFGDSFAAADRLCTGHSPDHSQMVSKRCAGRKCDHSGMGTGSRQADFAAGPTFCQVRGLRSDAAPVIGRRLALCSAGHRQDLEQHRAPVHKDLA